MTIKLPKFVVTSVVRGSKQGQSHGGVYTVDFEKREVLQHVDWNTSQIDFQGRGLDRGLRGIAFNEENILIAASDELFTYDRDFQIQASHRNPYLRHCHEICRRENMIFLTSTGYDSLLAFDLEKEKFTWGFHLVQQYGEWSGQTFDPESNMGPRQVNDYHINTVYTDDTGIYLSGLRTGALLHIDKDLKVSEICNLPMGAHNAQPYKDGILFNDTDSDCIRYVGRDGESTAFKVQTYDESDIEFAGVDDSKVARQGFGRGLCQIGDRFVAGGSSPSTVSLYDFTGKQKVGSVNLTMDIRNAVHGLEPWPYSD